MGGRMFSGFLILFGFTLIFAYPPVNKNELDNLDPYPNLDDPSDYYKPLSSDEFFDVLSDEFDEDNDSLYDGRIHHNQKRENLDEYTGENEPEATTENVEAGETDGDVVTGDETIPPLVNEEEGNEEESTQSPVHEDEEEGEGKQEEPSEQPVTEEEETQPPLAEEPTQPPLTDGPTQPPLTEEEPIQPPVIEEETNDETIEDPVDDEEEGKSEESSEPPAIAEAEEEEEPTLESSMDEEHRDSEDGAKGRLLQDLEPSQQYSATETPEDEDFEMKIKYFPDGIEEPRSFGPQSRIVGGSKVTDRSKFAYIASFRFVSGSHFCGASIIDDRNILTAAHCVYDENQRLFPARRLLLVVGDLQVNKKTDDTVTRVVRHIFPHEDYNYKTFEHDIAILRIDSLGEFTNYVNKVDLATVRPEVGTDCVVSGWGKTSFGGSPSNVLMQVTVPIVSREDCMRNYGNSILDGMLCAGLMEGGKDACQGDSGGPLVCNDKLAGVVSWGKDCALKDHPGVYTDVAAYYDWIVKTQGKSHSYTSQINMILITLNICFVAVRTVM